jgi:hypothetical protein
MDYEAFDDATQAWPRVAHHHKTALGSHPLNLHFDSLSSTSARGVDQTLHSVARSVAATGWIPAGQLRYH